MNLNYTYQKLACTKCERPILLEVFVNGVSHAASTSVTCAECIGNLQPAFVTEHPEAAADITAWTTKT